MPRICLGGGYRLWFPNAGGWFAFMIEMECLKMLFHGESIKLCMSCSPCNPGAIMFVIAASLASYTSILNDRKYITIRSGTI